MLGSRKVVILSLRYGRLETRKAKPIIPIMNMINKSRHLPPADMNIARPAESKTKNVPVSGWRKRMAPVMTRVMRSGKKPYLKVLILFLTPANQLAI